VAQKRGVLSVPRSAVRRESDNGGLPNGGAASGGGRSGAAGSVVRYVYVVVHRRAHRRHVEVGLIGVSEVEILGGLHEGERVIAEGPPSIEEDARVAETQPH
jgi:multidrug efflux pump subunit AcrA (membrane-fusion protein)